MSWEYKTYRFHDGGTGDNRSYLEDLLDKFGTDGWELVQIIGSSDPSDFTHRLAIFKRPKPGPEVNAGG